MTLLLLATTMYGQVFNQQQDTAYVRLYEQIKKETRLRNNQTAQALLDEMSRRAQQEGRRDVQIVVADLRSKLLDSQETVEFLEEQIPQFTGENRHIAYCMLGAAYQNYYLENAFKINERTTISDSSEVKASRVEFYDKSQFYKIIIEKYKAGFDKELKNVPADKFSHFDQDEKIADSLFSTLYDVLGYRIVLAMENLAEDQYAKLDDRLFCDAADFLNLTIENSDTDPTMAVFYFMQQLLRENRENRDLFVLLDNHRIMFLDKRQPRSMDKVQALLEKASADYADVETVIFINVSLAQVLKAQSQETQAVALLRSTMETFPDSRFIGTCINHYKSYTSPNVTMQVSKIAYPNEKIPYYISYSNSDTTKFKVVKMSNKASKHRSFLYKNSKWYDRLYERKAVYEANIQLPASGDYSSHQTYHVGDGLECGYYLILNDVPFAEDMIETNYCVFRVTKFELVRVDENTFVVVDRKSGKPIPDAKVRVIGYRFPINKCLYRGKTDSNGMFSFEFTGKRYLSSIGITASHAGDKMSWRTWGQYFKKEDTPEEIRLQLFADRAIYRPGQTVHFKAILYKGLNDNYNVVPDREITVGLFDGFNNKIAEQKLTTNQYGSVNGSFVLPTEFLNGDFYITTTDEKLDDYETRAYFRVEEYNRPTFEVTLSEFDGEVALGDTVTITGNAKSFSGLPISDAQVQVKVVCRKVYFRGEKKMDRLYGKCLVNEIVKTDANGDFAMTFEVSEVFAKDLNGYHVSTVVSDINGETQEANCKLYVGQQSFTLSSDIGEIRELSDFRAFDIAALNSSEKPVGTLVEVEIAKLEEPAKATVNAIERTDRELYTRAEWEQLCPHIEYCSDNQLDTRQVAKVVYTGTLHTANTQTVAFDSDTKFEPGTYRLTLRGKAKTGEEIVTEEHFRLYDRTSSAMPYVGAEFFDISQETAEVGDTVEFYVGSSFEDVQIYYTIQFSNKTLDFRMLTLSNEVKTIRIPVTEACYGGFGVTAEFVRYGRVFDYSQTVSVERADKALDIDFITFRDKTQPGAKESWQLKISDKFGNPAAAELMTTIYDASLDSYIAHSLYLYPYSTFLENYYRYRSSSMTSTTVKLFYRTIHKEGSPKKIYKDPYPGPVFSNFESLFPGIGAMVFDVNSTGSIRYEAPDHRVVVDGVRLEETQRTKRKISTTLARAEGVHSIDGKMQSVRRETANIQTQLDAVQLRTNLNETALFAPALTTDREGNLFVNFTLPEGLTRWNVLGVAHTADMKVGSVRKSLVTQKKVSVTPNLPRFFREGDAMCVTAKVANLTEQPISGYARIEFIQTATAEDVTAQFLKENTLPFAADTGRAAAVEWNITVPRGLGAVAVRVVAAGDGHSDGEERIVPILTNRLLVTETMPLPVRRAGVTDFTFDAMRRNSSPTREHFAYTLEFTANPAWYAILALPYMMEYPYECAEQTFSRLYSNLLAAHVANSDERIKAVFETWKSGDTAALQSNLQRNAELKSVLLENSPWLLDAESESESRQQLGRLFDTERLNIEVRNNMKKLRKMQSANGGFPWFEGMPASLYITQHIVGEYAHLQKLGVTIPDPSMALMMRKALNYIDNQVAKEYHDQKREDTLILDPTQIQYLYVRSLLSDEIAMNPQERKIFDEYMKLAEREWVNESPYMRGMLALAMHRSGRDKSAKAIVTSLKQQAKRSEEMGMYWELERGWHWYNSDVETQALLIELFTEMGETDDVREMKVWLLKQKQTRNWKSTKATAEAVYALFMDGPTILKETDYPTIMLGDKRIDLSEEQSASGTGYYKQTWRGAEISDAWSRVTVAKSDSAVTWGGVYWQYFEDLDKIQSFEDTPLKIRKALFARRVENGKELLVSIGKGDALQVGDKVTVRVEVEVDRDMEYVHLKDMRASAFEPLQKLSGYRTGQGLGYYQSIKDASVNFFFDRLPKGTYVFEYEVVATQRGTFSNGITTIQSMYAPEYTSHSGGDVVVVR